MLRSSALELVSVRVGEQICLGKALAREGVLGGFTGVADGSGTGL